jgi:hypothetical protein
MVALRARRLQETSASETVLNALDIFRHDDAIASDSVRYPEPINHRHDGRQRYAIAA